MRFRIGRGVVGDCPECERDRARAWRRVPDRHHRTPRMCVLLPPVNSPAVVTAALTWCRDGWEAGGLDSCNPEEPHRCPGPPDEHHPEGTPGDESCPMCDTAVSPQIASPEMWLGRCIGLETDIYAFGIVMWEVITRRQAWHWFQRESSTSNGIAMRIEEAVSSIDGGGLGKRPRMPLGLKKKPAQYMRFCMHELPSERPSAKELKAWLESQRRELDQFMQEQKRKKVREADMKTDAHRLQNMCFATITDRQHVESRDCWSEGGRYSLSRSSKLAAGRMKLTVTEETEDQWMEMALTGADGDEPTTPRSVRRTRGDPTKQPNLPREKFGIVFKAREINHWPKVLRVDQRDSLTGRPTVASHFPFIRSGAKLVKINDMDVPRTFSEALPMLKALPLTLEFDCAVDEAEMTEPEPEPEPEPHTEPQSEPPMKTANLVETLPDGTPWVLEFMWADAGITDVAVLRRMAKANPLRWTCGSPAEIAMQLRKKDGKDAKREVVLRTKGEVSSERTFASPYKACKWIEEAAKRRTS
eukprot:COSAG01_NODE_10140_length_2239_cov_2.596729_2_plen_529_part_00